MRISTAIRVFFKILFDAAFAERVKGLFSADAAAPPATKQPAPAKASRPEPARSDALTLLATLQQEARLVDLVKEPLDNYNDAQIGAAARDVLRDCHGVLERMFHIQPVVAQEEGTELETPKDFDAGRFRLAGNVTGQPPFRGRLTHHGWEATKCELPSWSGSPSAARVLAPAELELPS